MSSAAFFIISFCNIFWSEGLITLKVQGIDFHFQQVQEHPRQPGQIIWDKGVLFLLNRRDLRVFMAKPNGDVIGTLAEEGGAPYQISRQIQTMARFNDKTLVLTRKQTHMLFIYQGDQLESQFPVAYETLCDKSLSYHPLAVSEKCIIVPAHPGSGHLANAYDWNGNPTPFGDLFFDKRNADLLLNNRCLNQVLWVFDGNVLYGIMKYQPVLLKFNESFKLANSVHLENSRLLQLMEKHNEKDSANFTTLPGLFFKAQIRGHYLYLNASQTLFEIDLSSLKITRTFAFKGEGEAFAGEDKTHFLTFQTFDIAENGEDLFLGPGHGLDSELFLAKIPPRE